MLSSPLISLHRISSFIVRYDQYRNTQHELTNYLFHSLLKQRFVTYFEDLCSIDILPSLKAKLYELSKPIYSSLYLYLQKKLNNDIVNLILQFVFGNTRRVLSVEGEGEGEAEEERVFCEGPILSLNQLDNFLKYELEDVESIEYCSTDTDI